MPLAIRLAIFALTAALAPAARAQQAGDCEQAEHREPLGYLDANGVRAGLFNQGQLFWSRGAPHYEVPRGSGVHAHFAAGIWIGAKANGELRTAAATYGSSPEDYEYYPGPLDADGRPPADCRAYDHIWVVSRTDVQRYDDAGIATADLVDWPVEAGAPFFDVDGDGVYRLEAGDRPEVWGDETAWWVMNDVAGPHLTTLSEPMGLEVRATAFAAASPEAALHYTTFYRYEITHRGEVPLDSMYVALWNDADLGAFDDDYIGSDSLLNLGFIYNADDFDESTYGDEPPDGYGARPPALGVHLLETPEGVGMSSFNYTWDEFGDDPDTDWDYYNTMRGLWMSGDSMTVGGYGTYPSMGTPTTYLFPNSGTWEEPVPGFWSEVCPMISGGTCSPPNGLGKNLRFVVSTGPFSMEPGETEVVTLALVWARGSDRFASLQEVKVASEYVARAYAAGVLDPVPPTSPEPEPGPDAFGLAVTPNPFREEGTVRLAVPVGAPPVRVTVFDALGRAVAVLADGQMEPGEHALRLDGAALAPGVYHVRLDVQRQSEAVRVTHVE